MKRSIFNFLQAITEPEINLGHKWERAASMRHINWCRRSVFRKSIRWSDFPRWTFASRQRKIFSDLLPCTLRDAYTNLFPSAKGFASNLFKDPLFNKPFALSNYVIPVEKIWISVHEVESDFVRVAIDFRLENLSLAIGGPSSPC